jgi:ubiquinone/menaquinone biosynthesis C-methylase UbiE
MAAEQLSRLTLAGHERILDVGCGDGKITAEVADRVPHGTVLGIDPSGDMVDFASNRFGPPIRSNIRFEVGDARRLEYRAEFDLVTSFNALHWVPEQDLALRSIRAVLKPNGRAHLRLVPEGSRTSLEDVIEEVRQRAHWADYFADFHKPYVHFTIDAYRALAEQCTFQVVELRVMDKLWDFKTRDAFTAFARATFVEWTRLLPECQWQQFITDVLDRYHAVAADSPSEANTFKFYQMEVVLTPG